MYIPHPIHTEDILTQGQDIQGDHVAHGDILILGEGILEEVLVGMDGMAGQVPAILELQEVILEGDLEGMGDIMDPQDLRALLVILVILVLRVTHCWE